MTTRVLRLQGPCQQEPIFCCCPLDSHKIKVIDKEQFFEEVLSPHFMTYQIAELDYLDVDEEDLDDYYTLTSLEKYKVIDNEHFANIFNNFWEDLH